MDEAAISKALEGKFFWEGTTKYDPDLSRDCIAIRRAQRKYVPKEPRYVPPENWWRVKPEPANFRERVNALRAAVATVFGVHEGTIMTRSKVKGTSIPRRFFIWAMCRYFPDASLAAIAEMIGRHHSTVIYGRDEFKQAEHLYADIIEKMDAYMGHKPG